MKDKCVKSFYGKRTQQFFIWCCNQIQDDDPESADVVIIGPPTGRQDSDLENEDNEILNTARVTWENRWWSWSLQYYDEIERITSDGEDGDVEP